jgi:pimeloyl-ACP methyl ester carboxylesterase/DNA-binding winged helix-turn-helix (wHTH) protein
MPLPPVRFVSRPDGVKLAYAVYGSGRPLVWVANWLTHLELDFESPVWRHWVAFFTESHQLIRYDERGCGLSDWTDEGFDLDTWVRDLEAVVDAVGIREFDLLGLSQGGPIAVEYAVRHPERVRHLLLFGTYPNGNFMEHRQRNVLAELIETGWGASNPAFRQLFTSFFVPDATEEQRDWFNLLQARSTKPAIAAKLMHAFRMLDVEARLPLVTTPTLVLHCRRDAAIPFAAGRAVAAAIPNARFVPLESNNHIPLEGDPGWPVFCREFREFTGGDAPAEISAAAPAAADGTAVFRFGRCRLDLRSRELVRDQQRVPMENRAFDMLVYLIEHRDRAVSKDELQEAIWPRMILTESALTRCVMKARRAVGDDRERQDVIKTIHGHGYRFVAPLGAPAPARRA